MLKNDISERPLNSPDGSNANEDLVEAYRAELERLQKADSPERAAIYDKAADLGTRLIRGEL